MTNPFEAELSRREGSPFEAEIQRRSQKNAVDTRKGAPADVRALVGGLDKPADRLATLRQYYPDAMPDPVDPENFVYTDPETGNRTLYNPKGYDAGDVASVARQGMQALGGAAGVPIGAAGGFAMGGPPGAIAGGMAGGGLGTAAGEEAYGLLSRAFGARDTRTFRERMADTGIIGLGGTAGTTGGTATGAGLRGTLKAGFRSGREGREEVAQAVEDLAPAGVTPSLAQATKSPAFDALETFVSRTPGGAGRIRKAAEETNRRVAAFLDDRATQLAGTRALEPETAGRAVEQGIDAFVTQFRRRAEDYFTALDQHIPGQTIVGASQTTAALYKLSNKVPGMPELNELLVPGKLGEMAAAWRGVNGVPYETLKQIRSAIGEKLDGFTLLDDVDRASWKQLYGALSEDMRAAATESGPEAVRAFNRANSYYRAGAKRIEDSLDGIIRNKVPEQVYEALETSGKKGATKLRELRRSMPPDKWNIVAGTAIRRLGKAIPSQQSAEGGEFSFNTFLTNWNRLDDGAKDVLFSGPGMNMVKSDLERIARAAARIRESSKAFANPSGTASGFIGQAMLLAGAGSGMTGVLTGDTTMLALPAMLGVVAVGANAGARLMTSPRFIHWLARSTTMSPKGAGAHVGRLGSIAVTSDPETRDAIRDYLNVIRKATRQQEPQPQ